LEPPGECRFSAFISLGTLPDVSWSDLIYRLGDDAATRSILIYMESIGDARPFLSAAREVSMSKPIIVLKAGRTAAGALAAAGHIRQAPGDDDVLDAAFRRCGVLRVERISDLFYMSEVLSKQVLPRGRGWRLSPMPPGPRCWLWTLVRNGGELAPRQTKPIRWGCPWGHAGGNSPKRWARPRATSIRMAYWRC
jgi:acetyltransferase